MKVALITILMLVVSNIFMTFAWYGHLKLNNAGISKNWPLIAVILLSWGMAFLEYCFMIPANRIGRLSGSHSCHPQINKLSNKERLIIFVEETLKQSAPSV